MNLLENVDIAFFWCCLCWKFMFILLLHKSHIWENAGLWNMDHNAPDLLDCMVFKSNTSFLNHIDEKA